MQRSALAHGSGERSPICFDKLGVGQVGQQQWDHDKGILRRRTNSAVASGTQLWTVGVTLKPGLLLRGHRVNVQLDHHSHGIEKRCAWCIVHTPTPSSGVLCATMHVPQWSSSGTLGPRIVSMSEGNRNSPHLGDAIEAHHKSNSISCFRGKDNERTRGMKFSCARCCLQARKLSGILPLQETDNASKDSLIVHLRQSHYRIANSRHLSGQ